MPHETKAIKVWVDVDVDIADMVEYLNTIPGVRTQASCQGTIGEGGPHPYRAQVMCTWTPEALSRLQAEFDVAPEGNGMWGYVHPRRRATSLQNGLLDEMHAREKAEEDVTARHRIKIRRNGKRDPYLGLFAAAGAAFALLVWFIGSFIFR